MNQLVVTLSITLHLDHITRVNLSSSFALLGTKIEENDVGILA